MNGGRLPLTILGGFLGAGKSTWLRHRLHEGGFGRHHILVNEAAETPVDNLLLGRARSLDVLAGGCACCAGKDALLAKLRDICDSASGEAAGELDGILLETSGLADPLAIANAIAGDPVLVRRLSVAGPVVLMDASLGAEQLVTEPLARAQVETATRVILTKPDAASPQTLARLIATLRKITPGAEISLAERGVPRALPTVGPEVPPLPLPALARGTPILAHRLLIGTEGDWIALSTWLSALLVARGDDVIRVKGVVRAPAGRLLLQSVRRSMQPPEILPDNDGDLPGPPPQEGVIVLIGRNLEADLLARSWERFSGQGGK
ncbi:MULTISPECIES: CobW family GTP-binding protein [unclassified Haematobacter]|uniref:CobW family GTP-binding protein n=1 Tax=unclassified Haematobacter TaxID=2640585 RepID=UPI0025C4939F|nr:MULTISPECIES: CobW family GTP-binding protein [unclassified Haematobacter]